RHGGDGAAAADVTGRLRDPAWREHANTDGGPGGAPGGAAGEMHPGVVFPGGAAPSWSTVGGNRNQIGDVSGAAVQAEAVHGGVHIHGAARGTEKTVPRELPPGNPNFTNRSSEIERIIAAVRNRPADPSMPFICFLNGLPGVGKSGLALKVAHSIA